MNFKSIQRKGDLVIVKVDDINRLENLVGSNIFVDNECKHLVSLIHNDGVFAWLFLREVMNCSVCGNSKCYKASCLEQKKKWKAVCEVYSDALLV